jgi:hypothetical protein
MQLPHTDGASFYEPWQSPASARGMAVLLSPARKGEAAVDLALKWDVLAVCAVFAFVGAVLLGAF